MLGGRGGVLLMLILLWLRMERLMTSRWSFIVSRVHVSAKIKLELRSACGTSTSTFRILPYGHGNMPCVLLSVGEQLKLSALSAILLNSWTPLHQVYSVFHCVSVVFSLWSFILRLVYIRVCDTWYYFVVVYEVSFALSYLSLRDGPRRS